MPLSQVSSRDASPADSGSSITASAVTKGCKPIATWLRLCPHDFAAVVGIIFFVCYILWGIPLTVRLFKYCKSTLHRLHGRNKSCSDASSVYSKDLEVGSVSDLDSEFGYTYMDPYLSPTRQLHDFLRRSSYVLVPAPIASPKDKLPSRSPNMDDTLRSKAHLSQFRFPPVNNVSHLRQPTDVSSVFTVSVYSQTDTIIDSRHSRKSTFDELDDLVLSFGRRDSCSPYSCSTPLVNSKRRSSSSSSFMMFDLSSYKSTDDLLEDSCSVEDLKLPASPPPAYLEQHPAFGPSARFAKPSL